MRHQSASIDEKTLRLVFDDGTSVPSNEIIEKDPSLRTFRVKRVMACAYARLAKRSKRDKRIEIFSASLADIEKALRPNPKLTLEEITERLPEHNRRYIKVFDPIEAAKLPRYRLGFNYEIVLEKDANGKDKDLP